MDCLLTFRFFVCLSIPLWHIGDTLLQSEIRITKVYDCNNETKLKWNFQNPTILYSYPRTYVNGDLNVTEDTRSLKKVIVHLDRCIDHGFTCEDFQTWYIDNFCPKLNWKSQLWSGIVDALPPSFRCPIKKMIYQARNITLDINVMKSWYPDCLKYYWKVKIKILNQRDELVYCNVFEAYAYQYTKRNRKS